ncbi:MAG: HAD family hydrolase [Promethearchaeota archaeon]
MALLDDFDLIIFDMDGVILNIFDAINQAAIDGIKKYKIEKEPEEVLAELALLIEKLQTIPIPKIILNARELFQVSFIDYSKTTILKTLEIAVFLYSQFKKYKVNSSIYDGIDKIIKYIANKGKKLALLTNNKREYAIQSLEKFGLKKFFNLIVGYNEAGKLKPAPDGILKILNEIKVKSPKKVLFIGDMVTDVMAAKAANVKVLCVASGLAKREDLEASKPDWIVDDIPMLAKTLGVKM